MGSLLGRIVHTLRKSGANSPVFMTDEIDKLGADFRGDLFAAFLGLWCTNRLPEGYPVVPGSQQFTSTL